MSDREKRIRATGFSRITDVYKRQLYAKARKGEIKNFTGISAPFEEPAHPALTLDTSVLSLEESVNKLLELILQEFRRNKI